MSKGKTLKEVNNMKSTQVLDALGCLPKEHNHCALLAVKTLHKAISIYKNKEENDMKKQMY